MSARGFISFFKVLVYCKTESRFWFVWSHILKHFKDERPLLRYVEKTWMPLRDQWAYHRIKHYCNFGGRVTSTTESSNMSIKSFLINGRHDIHSLIKCVYEMTREQRKILRDKEASDASRVRYLYLGRAYLGNISTKISGKALDLINEEHRHVIAAIPKDGRPPQRPLGPCDDDCTVSTQLGIPCRHVIFDYAEKLQPLNLEDIHHHWHLQRDLADEDPYLRLKNPKMRERGRGRPSSKKVKNKKVKMPRMMTVPDDAESRPLSQPAQPRARAKGKDKNKQTAKKTAGKKKTAAKKKKTPGPPKGNAPRLSSSIRRERSQWEILEEEDDEEPRLELRMQPQRKTRNRLLITSLDTAGSSRPRRSASRPAGVNTSAEAVTVEDVIVVGANTTAEAEGSVGEVVMASKEPLPKRTRSGRTIA